MTARIHQSIPVFSQVRTLPRSSADDCTDLRTIRTLPHRRSAYCRVGTSGLPRGYLQKTYAACLWKKVSYPCQVPYALTLVQCFLGQYRTALLTPFNGYLLVQTSDAHCPYHYTKHGHAIICSKLVHTQVKPSDSNGLPFITTHRNKLFTSKYVFYCNVLGSCPSLSLGECLNSLSYTVCVYICLH